MRTELVEQTQFGHIVVLPWIQVQDLPGLCISPVGLILQVNRRPRLIYDYTFSGLHDAVARLALQEAIQFGTAFKRLLGQILTADPAYGPVFLSKIDLSDAYMCVWVRPEDLLRLTFVVVLHSSYLDPLIGFHLSFFFFFF